ncbi:unnamed protein product [Sphagnum troendelagicum]|uniref:Signal peptidase complex subunit 3 n=2 Tax=Sphagnum TaxID=13804 RepID=A0ABP0TEM4_9BRYO|nr:hypothetical protein BDL97_10G051500 [Sphagnum fallax]
MHSLMFRANAVLTFGITLLAALCCLASLSDNLHYTSPSVDLQILHVESFQRLPNGNDEVKLILNITADLQSLFTWNTKQLFVFVAAEYATPKNVLNQVSLWDIIVERKENATIWRRTRNKYSFVDQGNNLRGLDFNLTMYWNVMPLTGAMYTGKFVVPGFKLPQQYR